MAQMIYRSYSTKKHISIPARFIRLCRQIKGGEDYIEAILILLNILIDKQKATEEAVANKEMTHDDVVLHDSYLDDAIRSCAADCKKYDRDNIGRPVLTEIFTDGKFTNIVRASNREEPDLADKIVKRIETLDPEHPVYIYAEKLRILITNCRNALNIHDQAKAKLKDAVTEEEIARSSIRKKYEYNYHDMILKFGKNNANKFFPVIKHTRKKSNEENESANGPVE